MLNVLQMENVAYQRNKNLRKNLKAVVKLRSGADTSQSHLILV